MGRWADTLVRRRSSSRNLCTKIISKWGNRSTSRTRKGPNGLTKCETRVTHGARNGGRNRGPATSPGDRHSDHYPLLQSGEDEGTRTNHEFHPIPGMLTGRPFLAAQEPNGGFEDTNQLYITAVFRRMLPVYRCSDRISYEGRILLRRK